MQQARQQARSRLGIEHEANGDRGSLGDGMIGRHVGKLRTKDEDGEEEASGSRLLRQPGG